MINTPENIGQDWDRIVYKVRENIFTKIKKILGLDIAQNICYEKVCDPRIIESTSFAWRGSLYGSNSNSKFAAFNRHHNSSSKYKNLFFTGGTVHPGGGIPLCVSSANIVSKKILKKL
jgi:phytoene dehydrogenase-like protein